jgi:hypothetical protein
MVGPPQLQTIMDWFTTVPAFGAVCHNDWQLSCPVVVTVAASTCVQLIVPLVGTEGMPFKDSQDAPKIEPLHVIFPD